MKQINWKQIGMLVVSGAVGGVITLSGWLWLGDYKIIKNTDGTVMTSTDVSNLNGTGTTLTSGEDSTEAAVQKVLPSVVAVTSTQTVRSIFGGTYQQTGGGSGFIVRSDGLIVTNKHVVSSETATYSITTNAGKEYSATVVARDPSADLALMKISASNLPVVTFGDSAKLALGQKVIAIGNALGQYQNTVTTGIISGLNRSITAGDASGSEKLDNLIQTDAAINPGNSGGPLVNLSGQVIGINTAVDTQAQSVGFAIPINSVKSQISAVAAGGEIVRPRLGVRYIPIDADLASANNLSATQGALIASGPSGESAVASGSPASVAGIKEDDIIVSINGEAVTETNDLSTILQKYKPGDKVTIKLLRQGVTKTVTATLDKL
ncbi:MAG: trypsin-like peptidase domain-containing protein [Patescibacteria group bacterium]